MDKTITIYDIAKACHVSIATVSRVLNESPRVSPKTKEKILAKMKELQYNPNPFARGIGLDTMKLIGIVCRDVETYESQRALSLLTTLCQRQGYATLLTCTCAGEEEALLAQYQQRHVDGLLCLGSPFTQTASWQRLHKLAQTIPIIAVQGSLPEDTGYTVTSILSLSLGQILQKFAKRGLQAPLLLCDDSLYLKGPEIASYRHLYKEVYGVTAAKSIIALPSSLPDRTESLRKAIATAPAADALIALTDTLALTAWRLRPDLPIVSCMDSPVMEALGLTSLDTNIGTQCQTAASQLLSLLADPTAAVPIRTEFKGTWRFRRSFPEEA